MSHICVACTVEIAEGELMCTRHWEMLPLTQRIDLNQQMMALSTTPRSAEEFTAKNNKYRTSVMLAVSTVADAEQTTKAKAVAA